MYQLGGSESFGVPSFMIPSSMLEQVSVALGAPLERLASEPAGGGFTGDLKLSIITIEDG